MCFHVDGDAKTKTFLIHIAVKLLRQLLRIDAFMLYVTTRRDESRTFFISSPLVNLGKVYGRVPMFEYARSFIRRYQNRIWPENLVFRIYGLVTHEKAEGMALRLEGGFREWRYV